MFNPQPDPSPPIDPTPVGREAVLDRVYDVALDPSRLPELLSAWQSYLASDPSGNFSRAKEFNDPDLDSHLKRATAFLDRFEQAQGRDPGGSVLDAFARTAGFLGDGGDCLKGVNVAAERAFGLDATNARLSDLPFDQAEIETLAEAMRRAATGRQVTAAMLRVHSCRSGSPVILRVSPVAGDGARPLAMVLSTEMVWHQEFAETVRDAFGLTQAEVEVVEAVTEGRPLKDVAEARGRSLETVKTQMKSILAKTETHSQSELVRVILGLMDLMTHPERTSGANLPYAGRLRPVALQDMRTSDGRLLEWIEFGSPTGSPLLVMPQVFMLARWPAAAEAEARDRNIRVIVPIRAGYGRSAPLPRNQDYTQGTTSDYVAVLNHLGVNSCAVLAFGAELRHALSISMRGGVRINGVVTVAPQLPVRRNEELDKIGKWHRLVKVNALFAPKFLAFLIRAGFSFARQVGKETFFRMVGDGSPADTALLSSPELREAILLGSDFALGPRHSAHEAYAANAMDAARDWSWLFMATKVPTRLIQGDQDMQQSPTSLQEQLLAFPDLQIEYLVDAGQNLFFSHSSLVLDRLEMFLDR
jgi:DNA-binding NarL/FixJ family response regulator/pimeloyl-ACP methyl ester carboxylesterase